MTPVEYLHLSLSRPISAYHWYNFSGRLAWTCYRWRKSFCANRMRKDYPPVWREIDSSYCLDRQAIYEPGTCKPI